MRAPLINDNTSHEQAADILEEVWNAKNTIQKQIWQEQIDKNNGQQMELQVQRDADNQRIADELAREKEEVEKEERKKNNAKFAPIPKRGVPSHTPIILAPSAIRKMDMGQYVPLWYYTNTGLANQMTFDTVDEDALTIMTGPDGITTAVQATSSRESKGLVEDHNLIFKQFQLAALCMLMAM